MHGEHGSRHGSPDRLRTRISGRLPFVLGATPPLVIALGVLGFVNSILAAALVVAAFFAAYYVAYEPYRALYPDMVDDEIAGRAQSTQALFRGGATFLALVAGGLLLSAAEPVPFIAAAAVTALAIAVFTGATFAAASRSRSATIGARARAGRSARCATRSPSARCSAPSWSPTRCGSCRSGR